MNDKLSHRHNGCVSTNAQPLRASFGLHADSGLGAGGHRRMGLECKHLHFVRATSGRINVVTALHVLRQVGLGAETFAAHGTLERLFASVHALVI